MRLCIVYIEKGASGMLWYGQCSHTPLHKMGGGEGGGDDGICVYDFSAGVVNNGEAPSTSLQNHHHYRYTRHPYLLKEEVEESVVVAAVAVAC